MLLRRLPGLYAVCQLEEMPALDWQQDGFVSLSRTAAEISLVCPVAMLDETYRGKIEDGWTVMQLDGSFAFDLVGILAGISKALADAGVGIFAISTFDTDYILVKDESWQRARQALLAAAYQVEEV